MTEKIKSANGMKELHDTLRAEMTTAQLRHKEKYDCHRKPDPNLKSGDMVWFLPRNVHTTRPSKKLDYEKIGPFKILARIGTSAYKLAFPPSMKIHNTIHISLLASAKKISLHVYDTLLPEGSGMVSDPYTS